jgi:hypothetical protein
MRGRAFHLMHPSTWPPPAPVGSAPAVSTPNTRPPPSMATLSWTPRCLSPPHRCCSKGSWLVWPAIWGSGPGAEVVGASGRQPGPLGGGTSVRAELAAYGLERGRRARPGRLVARKTRRWPEPASSQSRQFQEASPILYHCLAACHCSEDDQHKQTQGSQKRQG